MSTTEMNYVTDAELEAYMSSFSEEGVVTKVQPVPEGWYPAYINEFFLNYYVVDKKPRYPEDLAVTADGMYPQHSLRINCQTSSLAARLAAKKDTDPYFSLEGGKNNCPSLNLTLVLNEVIGIDLKKSLGFLNFLGALFLPVGLSSELTENGNVTGYTLDPAIVQVIYGGVKEERARIEAEFESKGYYNEKDNKNHPSLIPAMIAEYQLKKIEEFLSDPSGDKSIRKIVVLLGQREHWRKDGSIENFAKDYFPWYKIEDSIETDSMGTTFKVNNKGHEVIIDLLV